MHSLNKFCDVAKERCQKVEIVKVTLDEITEEAKEFDTIIQNSKPIKDIKKMHYVNINTDSLMTCQLYSNKGMNNNDNSNTNNNENENKNSETGDENDDGANNDDWYNNKCNEMMPGGKIEVAKYVIVMYEDEYFPGLVTEIVASDVKVKTMAPCLGGWSWPKNDEIYYTMDNVIKRIEVPTPVNNRGT